VSGTGRSTIEPPLLAPFNFGIDQTWFENKSEEFARLVKDWGTHGNPEGFDEPDEGLYEEDGYRGPGGGSMTQSYGAGESMTQSYGGGSMV
jgi:hypothetical protein